MPRLALRLTALASALAVAACGGSGPSATPAQLTPTSPAETVPDVPTFDLGTFAPPSIVLPSFTSDESLEALLPDSIGGQVVVKQSMSGDGIFSSGLASSGSIEDVLEGVGATIDDVSVAVGNAANSIVVIAYRIDGVPAARVFDGFLTAFPSGATDGLTERTVAGRRVTEVVASGETTYIYLAGDVLFIIGGTLTPELLEDAVQQLPAR